MNRSARYWVAWLAFATVTAAIAMLFSSAAFVDGQYIPVSNDSFYHARRILDAAVGERGFYEFDTMIHVPEGSWINWPWAYDWLMAMALRVALWVRPDMAPMQFLAYVPVAFTFVNAGLLTLILRGVGASLLATCLGLLVFALSPLTQILHGVGVIDHHFIELTFVLTTAWLGHRLLASGGNGLALGILLGFACGFHNGLFILQLPVLAAIFVCWLYGNLPPRRTLLVLAAAIAGSTLLVALPSAAFRDMQFEFWTLSWFHLYVALGSAAALVFMAQHPFSRTNLGMLAAMALVLLAPVFAKLIVGTSFLSGELDVLSNIAEVRSPFSMAAGPAGVYGTVSLYSWLLFFAPVILVLGVLNLLRERRPQRVFLSVMLVFGIGLMLLQYRLHPFGFWAVIVGTASAIDLARSRLGGSAAVTAIAALAIVAIAMQPPLRNQLFKHVPPGMHTDYAAGRSVLPSLADACERRPGAALSYRDDGHPIRYHTNCSVVANNFLMTPFHAQKIREAEAYLQMTPAEFVDAAPHVRYLFVRMVDIFRNDASGVVAVPVDEIRRRNAPLFVALTFSRRLPEEYRLIDEVRVDDERDFAFVRVFEIVRN